jgi:hypothetical protein
VGILLLLAGLLLPPLWLLAIIFLVIGLVSGGRKGELTVTWAPKDPPPPASGEQVSGGQGDVQA